MKRVVAFVFVVCLVACLGGCASILSGKTQKVNVTTEGGKKYTATIDGQKYQVPSIIELTRENKDKVMTVDECAGKQVLLQKEVNPVFFVNILSGGVFGSTTDYGTDAMWKYEPKNVEIKCP